MLDPIYLPQYPTNQGSAAQYPTYAYPSEIRRTIEEVQRNTLAPEAMVAMEVLSALSTVGQLSYDYESPTGSVRPLSLFSLVIADSGERKTSVHQIIAKPIYSFDAERMKQYDQQVADYEVKHRIWVTKNTALHRQLRKLIESQEQTDELEQAIADVAEEKPKKPRLRNFIVQNVTERALIEAIEGDGEVITCMSDEGDVVIKGGIFRFMGLMNKAWDGATALVMKRSDGVNIVARNPRVSVSILMQSQVFKTLIEQRGEHLRGSGLLARCLVGFPESTQGRRYVNKLQNDWVFLPTLHSKMKVLLEEYAERQKTGNNERKLLQFSDEAKLRWLELVNKTEDLIHPWGGFNDIKDAASKAVEVMGRIAALLHIFSAKEGLISIEMLNSAVEIYDWHAGEFKRLFASEPEMPEPEKDAQLLYDFMLRDVWNVQCDWVRKNHLRTSSPVRSKIRLNEALDILVQRGVVWIGKTPSHTTIVNLIHAAFPYRPYRLM
jgi:hypothetical protein